jgi:phosphatidylglycerol---prolipoprotein diacylglyceryl transferase
VPSIYGILISLAILICAFTAERIVKKAGKDVDILWGMALWAVVCALIGARLYHVLSFFPYYLAQPLKLLAIYDGGLGIFGALAGGLFGALAYLRFKKERALDWLDIAAIVLPLGQAIGRWGNFFNQELYGLPTNLPWGIYIQPANRPSQFAAYPRFHPLFLYESILDIVLFLVLIVLYRRKKYSTGFFLAMYFIGYGSIRFILEFLRIDPWTIYGLNAAQMLSILIVLYGSIYIIRSRRI